MSLSRKFVALPLTVLVLVLASCGGSSHSKASVDKTRLDTSYSPQKSLLDAVTAQLQAEKDGKQAESFALLAPSARTQYKDVADWTRRLNELPAITNFKVESSDKSTKPDTQLATVEHKPAIDPFKGLSAAKETQTWTGHHYQSGWLVEPDPQTDPILPSDAKAAEAVKAWVAAVQACNKDAAHALQAIDNLLATATPTLCGVKGDIVVSAATPLVQGPESANVIDQYSTDALVWAKAVEVTNPQRFHVVVAPLGDNWKVLALY